MTAPSAAISGFRAHSPKSARNDRFFNVAVRRVSPAVPLLFNVLRPVLEQVQFPLDSVGRPNYKA
jgi:hypothetical protein